MGKKFIFTETQLKNIIDDNINEQQLSTNHPRLEVSPMDEQGMGMLGGPNMDEVHKVMPQLKNLIIHILRNGYDKEKLKIKINELIELY